MQASVATSPRARWPMPTKNVRGRCMPTSRRYSSPRHGHYTATTAALPWRGHLRSDQTIMLRGPRTSQNYPAPLRRISYYDADTNKRLVFLTNNFTLDALIIAKLYKCRWQIELFFKWLKQNLHIKAFFGTSDNAVKTQIWIAVSVYVLIAIIKKELQLQHSLAEILQILSIALFEQVPLQQVLTEIPMKNEDSQNYKQLSLFNL
jgi:IS4 transposase